MERARLLPRGVSVPRGVRLLGLLGLLALLLTLVGCTAKIGDSCTISTDCSVNGDRLCDTTQPEGYCTVFNCTPDTCPEDQSVCVAFDSTACGTEAVALARGQRFQRTFCMKPCSSPTDCRAGYDCVSLARPNNPEQAQVVDTSPPSLSVCMVPASTPPSVVDDDAGTCGPASPFDSSFWGQSPSSEAGADAPLPDEPDGPLVSEAEAAVDADGDVEVSSDADSSGDGQSEGGGEAIDGGADADSSVDAAAGDGAADTGQPDGVVAGG
jgi:hypothetical protein